MNRAKRGGKAVDENGGDEDSCRSAPGDKIRGRQNLKSGEDFRDSTLEGEMDRQSFEEQMEEETSETLAKRTLEDKASVSYSFSPNSFIAAHPQHNHHHHRHRHLHRHHHHDREAGGGDQE